MGGGGERSVKQGEKSSVPPTGSPTVGKNSGEQDVSCTRYRYSLCGKDLDKKAITNSMEQGLCTTDEEALI